MESDASVAIALYLADLLRENALLRAENHSLGAILRSAVQHRETPKGWSATLKHMRVSPEYAAVAGQHNTLITLLEKSATTRDIRQILAQGANLQRVN